MKTKVLSIGLITTFLVIFFTSCFKDDTKKYTAEEEILLREAYLDSLRAQGREVKTTENGVYYTLVDPGEGDYPKSGDTLTIGYSGFFIDGRIFDSSDYSFPDGKMEFILEGEKSRMIPGFEEGIKMINKGAKVQLIIPSGLAYGSDWYSIIPPYQTLIFVIKMHDIKPS